MLMNLTQNFEKNRCWYFHFTILYKACQRKNKLLTLFFLHWQKYYIVNIRKMSANQRQAVNINSFEKKIRKKPKNKITTNSKCNLRQIKFQIFSYFPIMYNFMT